MELAGLLPFILIFGLFWLLLVRPARQQQRKMAAVQAQLSPGTRVRTGSGLYGTVAAVHDDTVDLEVAPGVVLTYARAAVTQVVEPAPGQPADSPDRTLDDAGNDAGNGNESQGRPNA
jgi:preprotein translocase subunit YajC